jgi:hypothetical protein
MSAAYAQGPGNDRNQDGQAGKFPKWWEAEMEIYLRVRRKKVVYVRVCRMMMMLTMHM